MLHIAPEMTSSDAAVLSAVDEIRGALRHAPARPRRWGSTQRRQAQARAVRGSFSIEGINVTEDQAFAIVGNEDEQRTLWNDHCMEPTVISVNISPAHSFIKTPTDSIVLEEGVGVRGDAHAGTTVKHRSRVARDPDQPNLRQVHLIHQELFDQLAAAGHAVAPGQLGENITTSGIDLLGLPVGARLHIADAVIVVTGLRNPCQQINDFQPGLLKQVLRADASGHVRKLTGVMGIVARRGTIRAQDQITLELPPEPHHPLTGV